jgi:hypothetical protein
MMIFLGRGYFFCMRVKETAQFDSATSKLETRPLQRDAKAVRRNARLHLKALRRLIAIAGQAIEMAPPTAKDVAPVR